MKIASAGLSGSVSPSSWLPVEMLVPSPEAGSEPAADREERRQRSTGGSGKLPFASPQKNLAPLAAAPNFQARKEQKSGLPITYAHHLS